MHKKHYITYTYVLLFNPAGRHMLAHLSILKSSQLFNFKYLPSFCSPLTYTVIFQNPRCFVGTCVGILSSKMQIPSEDGF